MTKRTQPPTTTRLRRVTPLHIRKVAVSRRPGRGGLTDPESLARVGEFSVPPLVSWARYERAPTGFSGVIERVGRFRLDPAVLAANRIFRLAEFRGDLLFLRRRAAPAWSALLLVGAHDVYSTHRLADAESGVVVRFQPGAMGWATGMPAQRTRNVIAPLGAVWGAPGASLERQVAGLDDDEEVERVLLQALCARPFGTWNSSCLEMLRTLEPDPGSAQVETLVRVSGYGPRQLRRLFDAHVGLPPKLVLRILRMRCVLAALRPGQTPNWVQLAAACGHVDQAHLSTDMRWFTGMTPSQLLRSQTLGLTIDHDLLFVPLTAQDSRSGFREPRVVMAEQPRA